MSWVAAMLLLVVGLIGAWKAEAWWNEYKQRAGAQQLARNQALFSAAGKGDVAAVTQSLAGGANPNYAQLPNLLTPLMAAAQNNHPDVIRLLIKHGANPNAVSRDGNNTTALMYAVEGDGTLESVKALVEGGADVNARHGGWGYSALSRAGRYNGKQVVGYLIERGADVNIAGSNGATPLAWAKQDGNDELVALLRRAGAKESEVADAAVRKVAAASARNVQVERE